MDKKEYQKQFMQGLSKASTGAKVSNYLAVNLFKYAEQTNSNSFHHHTTKRK